MLRIISYNNYKNLYQIIQKRIIHFFKDNLTQEKLILYLNFFYYYKNFYLVTYNLKIR